MTDRIYDIVIAGGGPVGMALALALREYDYSVLLLEARAIPESVNDSRPLALSYGSRLILQQLNVWDALQQPTPISTIHISNRGYLGRTVLTPDDAGVPALGYVVNYYNLYHTMARAVRESRAEYLSGAIVSEIQTEQDYAHIHFQHNDKTEQIRAKLLVLADGGQLAEQIETIHYDTNNYAQHAIVTHLEVETPRPGTAFERFTLDGPLALLPFGEQYAVVWTVASSIVDNILQLDDRCFLARLQTRFGDHLGRFVHVGKRAAFPLVLKYASAITAQRTVLIGNAAQTLHPVAGQGFNLGLRGAWELADEIGDIPYGLTNEPGSARMLAAYSRRRQTDNQAGRWFTDSLIRLFTTNFPPLQSLGGAGLSLLDCLPPAKHFVARRMIFGTKDGFVG